jgi:cytochrome P450
MESLRIEPPVPFSSEINFTEDVTICGYKIRSGDPVSIDFL